MSEMECFTVILDWLTGRVHGLLVKDYRLPNYFDQLRVSLVSMLDTYPSLLGPIRFTQATEMSTASRPPAEFVPQMHNPPPTQPVSNFSSWLFWGSY